jgi:hypothetical protein
VVGQFASSLRRRDEAATLAQVASKKRKSPKRKTQRSGLSGNPQRRAEQSRQKHSAEIDTGVLRDLAYKLAGGAEPAPWWPESHERIIAATRAAAWPDRLVDVETRACELIGDEFYERLNSPATGLHPAQWLTTLAEKTGAALRTAILNGAGDWERLWALLCGVALTAPQPSPFEKSESAMHAREMFPDIHDPYETALAEAGMMAKLLADRGVPTRLTLPTSGVRPTGEPLVARDMYDSRILLLAPFSYESGKADHWYAWDIDLCWIDVVVGAGEFVSAAAAAAEWREAVGVSADEATLAPCPAGLASQLLDPCLQTGPLSDMLQGHEHRELIREFYRMRHRARALAWPIPLDAGKAPDISGTPFDNSQVPTAFRDWYTARHDDAPEDIADTVATIIYHWGPSTHPDEFSFYACSPHRIEMTARLLRDGYIPEYANDALKLLPEWTQWCLEQSGLDGEFAERACDAAFAESVALVSEEDRKRPAPDDEAPFRRQE